MLLILDKNFWRSDAMNNAEIKALKQNEIKKCQNNYLDVLRIYWKKDSTVKP